MVTKNNQEKSNPSGKKHLWSWLNLLLTAVLLAIGVWYIFQRVTLAELVSAITATNPLFILLSLLTILLTLAIKSWRWQILLTIPKSATTPKDKPPYAPLFWAFNLGAYVNLTVPFMRLGEIARLFAVNWMTDVGKARALGTIVVEKMLDIMMLGLTLILVLPYVILPTFMNNPLPTITAVSLLSILILIILTLKTKWVIQVSRLFASWLSSKWEERVMRWLISGLEGLDALRNKKQTIAIIILSAFIALLSILIPYFLFPAFHLNLGLLEAALLHFVVTLVATPPSTPGKIGVLNGTAALFLVSVGIQDEAIIIGYSTIYYLIVILPIIAFGGIAASRTQWKWQRSASA